VSHFIIRSKHLISPTRSRFIIHRHKTGRTHFDLRMVQDGFLRSWSLLKEPPFRNGERRLAVERERFPIDALSAKSIEEQAFGAGNVFIWDEGSVDLQVLAPTSLILTFRGGKVTGTYQFRKMSWYPGNRWMLTKIKPQPEAPLPSQSETPSN
jgi:bifunctional non-homologous end joining protein LigD